MSQLKGRKWHVQAAVAIRGEGLYEGLDWCGSPACSNILPGQGGCRSKWRCVPCWIATCSLRVLICCRTVGACRIFFFDVILTCGTCLRTEVSSTRRLASTLKSMQRSGQITNVSAAGR